MPGAAAQAAGRAPLHLLRACGRAAASQQLPARRCAAAATAASAGAARLAPHWWPCQPQQQQRQRSRPLSTSHASAAAAEAAAAAAEQPPAAAEAAPHISVLLSEVLAAFEGRAVRRYVDGTLGAAGHATAMLRQHPELESLVGFDLDPTAHQLASARLAAAGAAVVPVAVSPAGRASFELPTGPGGGDGTDGEARPTAFLVRSNFGRIQAVLRQLPLGPGGGGGSTDSNNSSSNGNTSSSSGSGGVDAILLDLGISSMQVRPSLL